MPAAELKFRLIYVGDSCIDYHVPAMPVSISAKDLSIQYNTKVVIDRVQSQVDVIVTMAYYCAKKTVFSGGLTTKFEVLNLSSYINAKEGTNEFGISNNFLPMLVSIGFSTARGYFAAENKGTFLEAFPFPAISVENILKRISYQLI